MMGQPIAIIVPHRPVMFSHSRMHTVLTVITIGGVIGIASSPLASFHRHVRIAVSISVGILVKALHGIGVDVIIGVVHGRVAIIVDAVTHFGRIGVHRWVFGRGLVYE